MAVMPSRARAESGGEQVNDRLEGFAVSFTGTITVKSAGARTPSKFPPGSSGAIMPGDEVAVISGEASFAGNGVKIIAGPGAAFKIADNESPLPQDRAFGIVSTGGAPLTVTTKDGSTPLAPGRIYRITNVRVNASSAGLSILSSTNTWTGTIVLVSAPKDGDPVSYKGHKGIFKNIKGFTATIDWGDGSTSQGAIAVSPEKGGDGKPLSYTITFQGSLSGGAAPGIFDRWGNEITEDEKRGKWLPPSPIPPDLEMAAKKALRDLADAYSAKNRSAFMRLLSEDFAGDLSTLEDALIKDFRSYRSVNLDLIPDRVDIQGASASVEFHYNLTVVSDQGANDKFSGRSSYVFHQEDGKARLYKMENPILFGNSLPASENPIAKGQNSVLAAASTAPGTQNVIRGSATITPGRPGGAGGPGTPGSGFKFSTQSNVPDSSADIFKQGGNIAANPEGAIVSIGSCNLDSVTTVSASITGSSAAANAGECYAVRTAADKYAVLRVTSTGGALGGTSTTSFDYKFQPSGSTSF